jgi:hypothetical protein
VSILLSESDCAIIRQLPIFSSWKHPDSYFPIGKRIASLQKEGEGIPLIPAIINGKDASSLWVSCHAQPFVTVIRCGSLSPLILPPTLLRHTHPSDLQLLQKLGVQVMGRAEFYRVEILPRVEPLVQSYPGEAQMALVVMLEELKSLCEEDSNFLALLRTTAFLPAASTSVNIGITLRILISL